MNKHSTAMVIVPPVILGFIVSACIAIIVGASSAAVGARSWLTDALIGFGYAYIVVLFSLFLLWLRWLYPVEKPVVVYRDQPEQKRELLQPENGKLVRDFESITNDQARLVAYHVKRGGRLSHNALAQYLTPKEIAAFQDELKRRHMAIDRSGNPKDGIMLVDKGYRELARYHSPAGTYEDWKNANSLYTHAG